MEWKRMSSGEKIFTVFNYLFLTFLMLVTIYPFIYVAMASVSDPALFMEHSGLLAHPLGFSTDAYKMVFNNPMVLVSYKNTAVYVVLGTTLSMILTTFGAYGLSRKNLYLKNIIMMYVTFTMFFSGGLIPTYLLVRSLGLTNTMGALIIPNAIKIWNLIVMRTYFVNIPDSLEESAKLDGANDIKILFSIMLPISMPIIAVMILFYAVDQWNAWFDAMIYLKNRDLYPLQLVLREILISSETQNMSTDAAGVDKALIGEIIKYATTIVATLPILFVYPFLQKYFVKGVMVGAIKG